MPLRCRRDAGGRSGHDAAALPRNGRLGTALDVGAGCGHVAEKLAPLFGGGVYATEVSERLGWRLGKRGIPCAQTREPADRAALEAAGLPAKFDVVLASDVICHQARAPPTQCAAVPQSAKRA